MCSNYLGIKLEPALGTYEDKIEHLSSYAHVVHITAKQVISRRRKNENIFQMPKDENARAKRAKILFFIVKYANLWGFCCRRRRGCLSSLLLQTRTDSLLFTNTGLRDQKTWSLVKRGLQKKTTEGIMKTAQQQATRTRSIKHHIDKENISPLRRRREEIVAHIL